MIKIVMTEQAVLELILDYWDNPSPDLFKNTLIKIRDIRRIDPNRSLPFEWTFELTPQSLVNLYKKYLNGKLELIYELHSLEVFSSDLSMVVHTNDSYFNTLPERLSRVKWY